MVPVIVGAFLGLLTNSLILSASPQVSDLEAVASTALGMAPVMGLIFGAISGALAFHMSDQKAFSASEFGRDVVIGAMGGLVQTLLLLVIGYIAMDGFFLTIIYIVTVIPMILALIGMFTLVATSVLAGVAWGLGFGLVRLTLWQIALQKAG